jgi:hypothetical protein
MDLPQQKEKFSDAYLQAVAAAAGCGLARPDPDDDSIDWILLAPGLRDTPRRPRLEVQLKCSARDIVREANLHFPLEIKNYNDLRETGLFAPRILIVLTVPENLEDWLIQTEQEMIVRHCAYWVSLCGMLETRNLTTVTVRLPRNQLFTPAALQQMMRRINDEGTL